MIRFVGLVSRMPRYLKLGWALTQDPTVSNRGKAALAGALGYALSPIDPVPGIIPVVGQLDDMAVMLLALRAALGAAPAEVAERHLAAHGLSRATLDADLVVIRVTAVWVAGRAGAAAGWVARALLRTARERLAAWRRPSPPGPEA
jgi:uncharacterized membrane protein YkvA (DUF1232 family)